MLRLFLLCSLLVNSLASRAQFAPIDGGDDTPTPSAPPPSRWTPHVDSIFAPLDRSLVSTGLLLNYGVALKDCTPFQGTGLTADNLLHDLSEWRLLYGSLQSSRFNAHATLPALGTANAYLTQAQVQQQNTNVVGLATLLARYERFRDNAASLGLVTRSGNQLYDNLSRTSSPYEARTLVAVCPVLGVVSTRTPQFKLASALRFTNAAPTLQSLEVDAGDGQGYRTVAWNALLPASYSADGLYTLRIRFTCADGTVLLSQAQLRVATGQVVADARYNGTGSAGVVTYNSTSLFTARPYTAPTSATQSGTFFYSATATITVAYAQNNSTNTIRRPLIVVEGFDASKVLNSDGVKRTPNYNYDKFVSDNVLGAIFIPYGVKPDGSTIYFNDQLSEVGQYDLIFVDFENGTDYIQRNAYLVESVIQWVNTNKQPLPGQIQKEKNIVLGMSTGGLIARYALRDMEKLGQNHDTRLYISHEAPHQGANVPLGIQYMIKGIAGITVAGPVTAGQLSPDLTRYAALLEEPATQQLLIYQTDPRGTALHNNWLNEYNNQFGYPTQCRNVATSLGSECGRGQAFGPEAVLLSIKGNGLLKNNYNTLYNVGAYGIFTLAGLFGAAAFGPASIFAGQVLGFIFALGDYEGQVDFVVKALPNQQQKNIYRGRFIICKDILLGAFTTCRVDYTDDNNSESYMLPYDSAPGGIYSLTQFAGGNIVQDIVSSIPIPLSSVYIRTTFCFVPTTSALDIGGGNVALGPQDLTATYANTAPPAAPRNTPFANFITAVRENDTHIRWTAQNSKWAYREMQGNPQNLDCLGFCQATAISGPGDICSNGSTYSIPGLPSTVTVTWQLNVLAPYTTTSTSGPTFTVSSTATTGIKGTVVAVVDGPCGRQEFQKAVHLGPVELGYSDDPINSHPCNYVRAFIIDNYDPALTYTGQGITGIRSSGRFEVKGNSQNTLVPITLTVTSSSCGTSSLTDMIELSGCPGPQTSYTVYPNPADDDLTVEQTDSTGTSPAMRGMAPAAGSSNSGSTASATGSAPTTPFTVRLYDSYGTLQLTQATTTATVSVPTSNLPSGLYLVTIEAGGTIVERRHIQVSH